MKKLVTVFLILFLLLCGCSQTHDNNEYTPPSKQGKKDLDALCHQTIEGKEKVLHFDSDVVQPNNLSDIHIIHASLSETYYETMAQDLIFSKYDSVQVESNENSYYIIDYDAEHVVIFISLDVDGSIGYTEVDKDLSGSLIGEPFQYGFFVEDPSIGLPLYDACRLAVDFSQTYSDFEYNPYRNEIEKNRISGDAHYRVYLQALIDGIPVCTRMFNGGSFLVDVSVGTGGISHVTGKITYSDFTADPEAISIIPLDQILEHLEERVDYILQDKEATVYHISMEFFATEFDGKTYSFTPVWSFYGKSGNYNWLICFDAHTGKLIYSGGQ